MLLRKREGMESKSGEEENNIKENKDRFSMVTEGKEK